MNSMKRQRTNAAGAFTLVELLVVIAMVAILAALLLPALADTKLRSHTANCMDNQRQLAVGFRMYAEDHDGRVGNMGDASTFDWRVRPGNSPWVPPSPPATNAMDAVKRYDE